MFKTNINRWLFYMKTQKKKEKKGNTNTGVGEYLIFEIFKDLAKFFVIFLRINHNFTKLRN